MIDQQLFFFFLLHYTVLMHCNCFQSKITATSLKKLVTTPKKRELDEKQEKNNKKKNKQENGFIDFWILN